MSKFRRVSELTTPDYLEKVVDPNYQGDPYAHLKKAQASRKQKIASNDKNFKLSQHDQPKIWEKQPEPTPYQDFTFPKNEEEYNMNSLGANHRVVRKADYGTDGEHTARDLESNLKFFTEEQYTQAMLRGASIWSPDMDEIADAFMYSQQQNTEAAFENSETKKIAREAQHEAWESEASRNARKSIYATARANPLLRTQNEMPVDMSFGHMDWSALDQQEQNRLQMRENRRTEKYKLNPRGEIRNINHQSWESNIERKASTMQDHYSDYGIDLIIE